MTCLMGLGLPGSAGTGLPGAGCTCGTLACGVHRNAWAVHAANCFLKSDSRFGNSMMLKLPGNNSSMNCESAVRFLPGTGPLGFAFDIKPLPFATTRYLPSGVT